MHYTYTYRNTPGDYWRFYMSNIYHQWTAIVNIIFTMAAIALVIARFAEASAFLRGLMIFPCLIFPVFQPLALYLRARKQALAIRVDTTLTMDDTGFGIRVKDHRQLILWKDFKGVLKRWDLLVFMPDETHAYLLPGRVSGTDKENLYSDVKAKLMQLHAQ